MLSIIGPLKLGTRSFVGRLFTGSSPMPSRVASPAPPQNPT